MNDSTHCTSLLRPLLSLILCLMLLMSAAAQSSGLDGKLANAGQAVYEGELPASAIDTERIPQVRLNLDDGAAAPLPVYRLSDDTYFLFGNIDNLDTNNRGWNGNAGFVVTSQGVVVIDSLGTPLLGRRLIATIRSITDRPIQYLILTHNHPDHAYGAAAFTALPAVTVIAHEGIERYNRSATLQQSVDYRREVLSSDMQGSSPVEADILVGDKPFTKKRITLGEAVFDIYNTGAHHSYGDLVVHQVRQDIVWISDLAFNQRTTYMGDGDSAQIIEAQDWLMDNFKQARLMVPGHGSAQTPPFPMVTKTHEYVTRMREVMRHAVQNGVGLQDAVQNVEFADWQDTRLYEQNQRANANFVYREMERAYFDNF